MAKILILDDQISVVTILTRMLETAGWQVVGTSTYEEAMSALQESDFAVVLSDIDVGAQKTGLDLLRNRPLRNLSCPVVFLTGNGTVAQCREALLAGAKDFLEKPVDPAAMSRALAPYGDTSTTQLTQLSQTDRSLSYVRSADAVILRRFTELRLSRNEIAAEVHVSADYLNQQFQTHLSHSLMEHVHNTRILAAGRMLLDTIVSVYEIARECGYSDTRQLDVHFKKVRGCTPSDFRRRSSASAHM